MVGNSCGETCVKRGANMWKTLSDNLGYVVAAVIAFYALIALGCWFWNTKTRQRHNSENQANILSSLLCWNHEVQIFGWKTEPTYGGVDDTLLCVWAGGSDWWYYLKSGVPEYEHKNKGDPPRQIIEAFAKDSVYGELSEKVLKLAAAKLKNLGFDVCVRTSYGGGSSGSIRRKGTQSNLAAA